MTRDEEVLRRALRSAADSIEPAADGLTRIRERVWARRRARAGWLLESGAGLAAMTLPRLQAAVSRLADLLRTVVQPLQAWFAEDGPRHARRRPVWRRPAVAIGAVVFVAAAAGITASGLPQEISQSTSPSSATRGGGAVSGGSGSGLNGSGQPYGSAPGSRRASATPSPSCSPSPSQAKNPDHASPSPTASPSARPSPTPSPTQTPSPTPSPSDTSDGSVINPQGTPDQEGELSTAPQGTQALGASRLTGSGSGAHASPSPSPSRC